MENIKALLGDAYKEGMTLEEVNSALSGKKLVDLSTGDYVAKDKYEKLETKHKNLQSEFDQVKEQTKDYDALKTENEKFKGEKATNELKTKIVGYGIKESAFKYVKGDIDAKELELGDDDEKNKANVKTYLEAHPEFAKAEENNGNARVEINTGLDRKGGSNNDSPKVISTPSWNKNRGTF